MLSFALSCHVSAVPIFGFTGAKVLTRTKPLGMSSWASWRKSDRKYMLSKRATSSFLLSSIVMVLVRTVAQDIRQAVFGAAFLLMRQAGVRGREYASRLPMAHSGKHQVSTNPTRT